MDGALCLATSNTMEISFSESPLHLLTKELELKFIKWNFALEARHLTREVLPVPGKLTSRLKLALSEVEIFSGSPSFTQKFCETVER